MSDAPSAQPTSPDEASQTEQYPTVETPPPVEGEGTPPETEEEK